VDEARTAKHVVKASYKFYPRDLSAISAPWRRRRRKDGAQEPRVRLVYFQPDACVRGEQEGSSAQDLPHDIQPILAAIQRYMVLEVSNLGIQHQHVACGYVRGIADEQVKQALALAACAQGVTP
jgi:hypothetical protein